MIETLLLVDVNNLVHRASHAVGHVTHGGRPTGALFGFLQDVLYLRKKFRTDDFVFAFDYGKPKRREIYPQYKSGRLKLMKSFTPEEVQRRADLHTQMEDLVWNILPRCLGYPNVHGAEGYEADDVIASVCETYMGEKVIVTSDKDLYSCLNGDTHVHHPGCGGRIVTLQSFYARYGILPEKWIEFKSMVGDRSDSVPGVPGVGEITALGFMKGDSPRNTKGLHNLTGGEYNHLISFNKKLFRLPHPGCPEFRVKGGSPSVKRWKEVLTRLGMSNLVAKV